jgi:hypothetical protein
MNSSFGGLTTGNANSFSKPAEQLSGFKGDQSAATLHGNDYKTLSQQHLATQDQEAFKPDALSLNEVRPRPETAV